MGSLSLPASGPVYLDANCFIYTVERIQPYYAVLDVLWQDVSAASKPVLTSDLTVVEVLTKPISDGDSALEAHFRLVLYSSPDVRLRPISRTILERAAQVRASTRLKTPDAIHAATALEANCGLFLTNDTAFQGVAGLPVTILSDVLTP